MATVIKVWRQTSMLGLVNIFASWGYMRRSILQKIALPVHLLRQVCLGRFFRLFFASFLNMVFSSIFYSILERFWKLTCVPKSILERFLGCFFWYPLFVAFFDAF